MRSKENSTSYILSKEQPQPNHFSKIAASRDYSSYIHLAFFIPVINRQGAIF